MALDLFLTPNFWVTADDPRRVYRSDTLAFMVLPITARMQIIYRTEKELFTTAVAHAYQRMPFACAINCIQYSVTSTGVASAFFGQPVAPEDTTPDGQLVVQGKVIGGRSAPRMFYMVNNVVGGYDFGQGDPTTSAACGVGGVGPIVINGLPYGIGNRCRRPAVCAPTGPIAPDLAVYVEQRNNATYEAQQNKAAPVGKTIVATSHGASQRCLGTQVRSDQGGPAGLGL